MGEPAPYIQISDEEWSEEDFYLLEAVEQYGFDENEEADPQKMVLTCTANQLRAFFRAVRAQTILTTMVTTSEMRGNK